MAETLAPLIDYYSVLNLPPRADLAGIENAYARISDELVKRSEVDETSQEALARVNEAYAVLSRPDLRRAYDQEFFRDQIEAHEKLRAATEFRKELTGRLLVGVLAVIVVVQAAALFYIGRSEALSLFNGIAALFS